MLFHAINAKNYILFNNRLEAECKNETQTMHFSLLLINQVYMGVLKHHFSLFYYY